MATEDYIPVAADDWYQRRREDAEGAFFRRVADQSPHKGEGGSTRQGIYCLTADGTLLRYRNAGKAPDVMRRVLRDGLAAWRELPESRRRPGGMVLEDLGRPDDRYARTPPPGGAIVKVFTRALERAHGGALLDAACETGDGDEAARDHLWLTRDEIEAMVPADPRPGQSSPVPPPVVERIARFHLVDNTRGEPPSWRREQVRSAAMTLTVEGVTPREVRLRLDGAALLSTAADADRAGRGYDLRLLGHLSFSREADSLTQFDVVALGEHWGEASFTRGARPGRTPLGVAFELARDTPADRVPPQGAREWRDYLGH